MSKAVFVKRDGVLRPVDDQGLDILCSLKEGREVMVHIHAARNPRQHRLLFALLKMAIDGGAWEGDTDSLLDYIKFGVGHTRTSIDPAGKVHIVPKSINYESMAQDAFRKFFDRAVWLVCHRLLANDNWELLRDEIVETVDGPYMMSA
jgi:hypothetical protein